MAGKGLLFGATVYTGSLVARIIALRKGFKSGGWLGPLGAFGQAALTQGLREAGYGPI